jgi:hypothetical protein
VVSFTPRPPYPPGEIPGANLIGSWVRPRAGLDDVEKRKFLTLPALELRPLGRPACSQSLCRQWGSLKLKQLACVKTLCRYGLNVSVPFKTVDLGQFNMETTDEIPTESSE